MKGSTRWSLGGAQAAKWGGSKGFSGNRGKARGALIASLAFAAALVFPSAALADHLYLESFGPDGTEGSSFAGIEGSRSVAIDRGSGTLYVANQETESIHRFDEGHHPENFPALGSPVLTGVPTRSLPGRSQLAVDQVSHRLYVTSINSIFAFEPNGAPGAFSALGSNEISGFSGLCGVAIDSNGDIYAADRTELKVTVFAPNGSQLTEFEVGEVFGSEESGPCNLDVDSAGNVYVNHWASAVEKFAPSFFPVTGLTTYASVGIVDPGQDYSLSINPATDHLYVLRAVGEFAGGNSLTKAIEYDPAGSEVPSPFGEEEPGELRISAGIAVRGSGASERIYVSSLFGLRQVEVFGPFVKLPQVETLQAGDIAKTTATAVATLSPRSTSITQCSFEFGQSIGYGESMPCDQVDGTPISSPAEIPVDSSDHAVAAHLTGLVENAEYHFRIVVGNEFGVVRGVDRTFETLGPPVIDAESVSGITNTRVRVGGVVDPRGESTTFQVQYVTQAQFEANEWASATAVPQPPKSAGSNVGPVEVSQELLSLLPGTVYHFRLVATHLSESPVNGEDRTFATFPAVESELPDGRVYELVSPPVKAGEVFPPEGRGLLNGSCGACLPGSDLLKMPMQPSTDGNMIAYEGQTFGPGTASEANEYLAERAGGWTTEGISKSNYLAGNTFPEQGSGYLAFSGDLERGLIFQATPSLSPASPQGYANIYLWRRGGSTAPLLTKAPMHRPAGLDPSSFLVVYGGANAGTDNSAAFGHVIFEANDALTAGVPGVEPPAPEVTASERNLYEWVGGELRLVNVLPGNGATAPEAVFGSGRLLSVDPANEGPDFAHSISDDGSRIFWTRKDTGRVYVRRNGAETVEIPDSGSFLTAAADGSRVLVSTGHLYSTEPQLPTQIADLTANLGGFEGILGASADLSQIYFVDSEVLPSGNGSPTSPVSGKDNLYVWDEGGTPKTTFVATLIPQDNGIGLQQLTGDWRSSASFRTAQVSPDGRYLAFMSAAPLTSYDNKQRDDRVCLGKGSTTGMTACTEVYEFDSVRDTLACASCNPSGERPRGYSNLSLILDGRRATFMPQPYNLTSTGTLIFESQDTLLFQDTNGAIQDVYEWKPIGPGCSRTDGCLSLISSGHSPSDSHFVNATPDGDDAFIVTRERLVPSDQDDLLDLYDARIGGGFGEGEVPSCTGEACRGALPPLPIQRNPATASYVGLGNPPVGCRAGYSKKHGKCVKKHKKRKRNHVRGARGGAK